MTSKDVLADLKKAGTAAVRKIFINHGAVEPVYGVKVADMKIIQKKVKENKQQVALELFDSGVGDAQYLAGLMANGALMSKKQLSSWAAEASWPMISESTVAWVASEHKDAWEIALEWVESRKENVASSGWMLLACIVSMRANEELNLPGLRKLIKRVQKEIKEAQNRVTYSMNSFLIACGSYVEPLQTEVLDAVKKIGTVTVQMGNTACKVPAAAEYIEKSTARGSLDRKKKTMKC